MFDSKTVERTEKNDRSEKKKPVFRNIVHR
jgi:hypothetical protein